MNILYLTNHLNPGGITSYVFNLAGGMKQRGHGVYIASGGGALLEQFDNASLTFIPVPLRTKQEFSPKILISFLKISGTIKRNHIDIVHSNSRTTQVLGCMLERFCRVKHVSTCHGFFKARWGRRVFPCWGERVIAVSEPLIGHLTRDLMVTKSKIKVIHSGIDSARFRPPDAKTLTELKRDFGLGPGPVVGIIARLSEEKGHIYLIEAMRNVVNEIPAAQLLIIGEGRMQKCLAERVRELGFEKNVRFIPSIADTRSALSVMDIFVLPSVKEGLGLALMEAMAMGLAVIGSSTGGIKSLIQHASNGLLFEPADVGQLCRALKELLRDEEKRRFLGTNAREFIRKEFSLDKMLRETEEVYAECLR